MLLLDQHPLHLLLGHVGGLLDSMGLLERAVIVGGQGDGKVSYLPGPKDKTFRLFDRPGACVWEDERYFFTEIPAAHVP